jgi:hypothetical protein
MLNSFGFFFVCFIIGVSAGTVFFNSLCLLSCPFALGNSSDITTINTCSDNFRMLNMSCPVEELFEISCLRSVACLSSCGVYPLCYLHLLQLNSCSSNHLLFSFNNSLDSLMYNRCVQSFSEDVNASVIAHRNSSVPSSLSPANLLNKLLHPENSLSSVVLLGCICKIDCRTILIFFILKIVLGLLIAVVILLFMKFLTFCIDGRSQSSRMQFASTKFHAVPTSDDGVSICSFNDEESTVVSEVGSLSGHSHIAYSEASRSPRKQLGSFYKQKFSQWTGARRKQEIPRTNQYELASNMSSITEISTPEPSWRNNGRPRELAVQRVLVDAIVNSP